jgi:hypothetical protein
MLVKEIKDSKEYKRRGKKARLRLITSVNKLLKYIGKYFKLFEFLYNKIIN